MLNSDGDIMESRYTEHCVVKSKVWKSVVKIDFRL